jgi:hypothetical protein
MATTPNFNWSTPDNTGLVKNGALDIRTLGDSIDASLVDLKGGTTGQVLKKATNTDMDFVWSADSAGMTNPMTTTGDTIYSSSGSTPARLGIGSTGQILTVAGGVPTWATPSAGSSGMTLIARTDFSNVASQAFDGVFTSTYRSYLVIVEKLYSATATDDALIQMRYAGPTTETSAYYQKAAKWNGSWAGLSSGAGSSFSISDACGTNADYLSAQIYFNGVGNTSEQANMNFTAIDSYSGQNPVIGAGVLATNRTWTGLLFKSSSSNITGRVAIYGLAV